MHVSNIVLHASVSHSEASYRRDILTGMCTPSVMQYHQDLPSCSTLKRKAPFTHYRLETTMGPILLFRTGSIIRAGGNSPSTGIVHILRTFRWLHSHSESNLISWPSAVTCPNLVLHGQIEGKVPKNLHNHKLAHKSSRFPGTAVRLPTGATPEIFNSGKYIVPGAKSIDTLDETLCQLDAILEECADETHE